MQAGRGRRSSRISLILGFALAWSAGAHGAQPGSDWMSAAKQRVADAEYEISRQGTAWQAPNRVNKFRTTFAPEGVRTVPRVEQDPSWTWGLTLTGIGRPGAVTPVEAATMSIDANRVTYDRGGIVEWYVNDPRGLEQGFTLKAAPSRARGEALVELSLTGTLEPSFSSDGQAVDFKSPGGAFVLHYASLRVVDAQGRALPSRMEGFASLDARGIRLVYDDTDAVYPVTVDPLATTAAWSAESNQDFVWYGYSVSTAGDVNGDGYSDVIVGAPFYDNGQSDEGRAYVYLGSASGLGVAPAWTAESDQANAYFGWSAASAGDVNGDGYADVVVGAYQYGNGQFQEGRAYVYYGSASGLSLTANWTAESDVAGGDFGYSVATAGDVNGDGYADVIVGAPYLGFGRVYVFLGSASGLATTAAWTKTATEDAAFGSSVSTAGDVNGDGYADILIGAEFNDTDLFNEGKAYVFHGSASGLALTPAWIAEGDQAGAQFGHSVSTAGDVNGDGYSDVIVGAFEYDNGQTGEGRSFIYMGSATGLQTTIRLTMEPDQTGAHFGVSVATAGDINGDGYADVIVGSERYDAGVVNEGLAQVFLGSSFGLSAGATWTVTGPQTGAQLGISVGTAGDVNGDGYSDVIVGANLYDNGNTDEGAAFVYYGSAATPTFSPAWSQTSQQTSGQIGASVASAGDVNGDGYSDVIVGAGLDGTGGRAYLYLGSATGLGTTPAWTMDGPQAGAAFGWSVAPAGDVNGDGYADVLIGAENYSGVAVQEGAAYLVLGSPSGLAATTAWSAFGDQAQELFSRSLASAGDVNGDGYSDVIVAAMNFDGNLYRQGKAFVYLGSPTGLSPTPAWTALGNQEGASFGYSVAGAGDVNGDGYSDVVVGAYGYDNGEDSEGRAFLYLGSASGLATTPAWTAEGNQVSANFGASVASAGDVNGDGRSDVIIGAENYDNGQLNEGRAFLYLGSPGGLAIFPVWSAESDKINAKYGSSVASAGDVNADGFSDVIVGAWQYDGGQIDEGRAYVYLGNVNGLSLVPLWQRESDTAYSRYALCVASAGDVNGDGFSDIIVAAPALTPLLSSASVYLGNAHAGAYASRIPRQARTDGTTPIGLLGKSDSETQFRLLTRGRTPAGRDKVRLQWEIKPLGTPYSTTGIDVSTIHDTGAPTATGSTTDFNELASGLNEGSSYHWRLRIVSSNPFFPVSPWWSVQGDGITETKLRTSGCVDGDGDGYGAIGDPSCLSAGTDCNDADATIWGTPGPTANLRFTSGKTTLGWDVPAAPGAFTSSLVYDTIRATQPNGFMAGTCIETNNGPNTTAIDSASPAVGQAFFYLNRAQNNCPVSEGSLGTNSANVERLGVSCP
jgi:hypothetical protein